MKPVDLDKLQTFIIETRQAARELVKGWSAALVTGRSSAMLFNANVQLDDRGAFLVGYIDEEFRESGYRVVSISHALIGKQGESLVANVALLVRSIDETVGNQPRVLLG